MGLNFPVWQDPQKSIHFLGVSQEKQRTCGDPLIHNSFIYVDRESLPFAIAKSRTPWLRCQLSARLTGKGMLPASKDSYKQACFGQLFCLVFIAEYLFAGWRFLCVFLTGCGRISRVKIPLLVLKGDLSSPQYKMHPKNLHCYFIRHQSRLYARSFLIPWTSCSCNNNS